MKSKADKKIQIIDFWTCSLDEEKKGFANIDVHRFQQSGNATKIDKLFPKIAAVDEGELKRQIIQKHGAGAYRLKRYNKPAGGFTVFDFVADQAEKIFSASGSDGAGFTAIVKQMEKQAAEMEALRKQITAKNTEYMLAEARADEIKTRTELMKKREELEMRQIEGDMKQRGIVEHLMAAFTERDHPLHSTLTGLLSAAPMLLEKLNKEKKHVS